MKIKYFGIYPAHLYRNSSDSLSEKGFRVILWFVASSHRVIEL